MASADPLADNILQVILDGLAEGGHSMQPLVRVCIVGNPADGPADALEKWCAAFLKEKAITGLLLTMPTGWIMLMEGVHAECTAFVRAIGAQEGKLYTAAKVIHHAEDVPARAFSMWGAKSASAARNNYADIEGDELAAMLGDLVIGMMKIGQGVGAMEAGDMAKIDRWADHFPDIPSNERVGQVLEVEEVPSLAAFLGIFDAPIDISMQADRVWPPERAMVY